MNKDLKNRIFNIPQNILDLINHTITGLNGNYFEGVKRAQKLLNDKTVTYGQLKKIIHDFKKIDKINDKIRYNLYGGDLMEKWSKQHLQNERDLISKNKDSRKQADNIAGINGERTNSHIKTHRKKDNYKIPTNILKSNSHKTSISPLISMKLFEEIEKIKKLVIY